MNRAQTREATMNIVVFETENGSDKPLYALSHTIAYAALPRHWTNETRLTSPMPRLPAHSSIRGLMHWPFRNSQG